ncbi:9037_t:CDS:2 [Funneliformis caledonium]|uniref:9037_t:CDS:1 n=1 Tax=Funneliformis caledonium TaxID=1117310 RepID=A0A9N9CKF9_9GLOM|nr:9037_t:CDS:2 [Funneliformis caledonium]
MGCCYSRNDDDSFGHEGSDENHVPRGGNKPFTKKGMTWTSESPVTIFNLKQQRDAFWDTAPSYEGRLEIWQALRCACESEDLVLSQAIIDSANVTIPTGNLADGCYDELGNKYVIPLYCIVEPTNLIDYNAEGSSEREDLDSKLLDEELTESEHIITIRLSSNAKDVKLNYNPKLDTIATLRAKLCTNQNLEIKKYHVRFFLLGRIFEDKTRLCDVSLENEQILQAFISEKF